MSRRLAPSRCDGSGGEEQRAEVREGAGWAFGLGSVRWSRYPREAGEPPAGPPPPGSGRRGGAVDVSAGGSVALRRKRRRGAAGGRARGGGVGVRAGFVRWSRYPREAGEPPAGQPPPGSGRRGGAVDVSAGGSVALRRKRRRGAASGRARGGGVGVRAGSVRFSRYPREAGEPPAEQHPPSSTRRAAAAAAEPWISRRVAPSRCDGSGGGEQRAGVCEGAGLAFGLVSSG